MAVRQHRLLHGVSCVLWVLALATSLPGLGTAAECQLDEALDLTHRVQELDGSDVARFVRCFAHLTGAPVDDAVFSAIVTGGMHGEELVSMSVEELGDVLRLPETHAQTLHLLLRGDQIAPSQYSPNFVTSQAVQDELELQHQELGKSCASNYFSDGLWMFAELSGYDCGRVHVCFDGECNMLAALNTSRILFVGDVATHQLALAAERILDQLVAHSMPQDATAQERSRGEKVRFCNGAVDVQYIAGSSWNALAADPSLARLSPHDLIVTNVAPGLRLSEWKWMLGATTSQMDVPPQLIDIGAQMHEACRAWVGVRRFGSLRHLHQIRRRHAARLFRPSHKSDQPVDGPSASASHTRELEAGGREGGSSNRRNASAPLCRGAEYARGRWKMRGAPSTHDKTLFGLAHQSVICEGFEDMYEWEPSRCRLLEWDARKFCRQLGNRSVLLMGDSTVHQTDHTIRSWIRSGFGGDADAGCERQIFFRLSDTLIGRDFGINNRGMKWAQAVGEVAPDVVILSAYRHIVYTEHFLAVINQVSHEHQSLFPDVELFWMTAVGAGCDLDILEHPPSAQTDYWRRYEGMVYQYDQFAQWDDHAREVLGGKRKSHILDLQPLHLRADAHPGSSPGVIVRDRRETERWKVDCSHMCMPGPLDLVPQLIYHELVRLDEERQSTLSLEFSK